MTDGIAYRSRDPRALALWETFQQQRDAFTEQLRATLAELGVAGRNVFTRDHLIIGIRHEHGDAVPDGWRISATGSRMLTPDRRSRGGKTAAKKLRALRVPDPRGELPGGMPGEVLDWKRRRFHVAGLAFADGALYVSYQAPRLPEEYAAHIDPNVWEQVPLSAYDAATKQQEAATGTGW